MVAAWPWRASSVEARPSGFRFLRLIQARASEHPAQLRAPGGRTLTLAPHREAAAGVGLDGGPLSGIGRIEWSGWAVEPAGDRQGDAYLYRGRTPSSAYDYRGCKLLHKA